ncbi:hypothetical protein CULT_880008 [[Clostridium] ultunense Esp]|nr:hypothetical protein CULT_880008 [[Clostridium] ultunense Esp]
MDLSQYMLELYTNGSASAGQTLSLSGTLASGKTYVIVHGSANDEMKSKANLINSSVINFNGDDALVLKHNDTIIDSFGKVGEDPGTSWGSGNITTADHTLVRKSHITQGDTNPYDVFDPSLEWDAYPKDDASHLVSHTMDGFGGGEPHPEPGPVSTTPNAMDLLLDNGNPEEAKVMGDVNAVAPNAEVKLYLTNPKEGATTVGAAVYAGGDGAFTLTFNNSGNMNGFVFLTATEEGKGESAPLELHEAVVSPAVDGAKVTFQVDGNGRGIVTGMAGAASAGTNTPFIYVYSGNPAEGGTRLTDVGTNKDFVLANTDGSFTFTFTNSADMGEIYLSQLTWSHYGRNFESSAVAVPKSDQPAETMLPIKEVKGNDGNGKPLRLNETVTVEGIVTIANNIVGANSLYIQDATGGINLFRGAVSSSTLIPGDKVRVTGKVAFYNGLTELTPDKIDVIGTESLPMPQEQTLSQLVAYETAEPLEGMLVKTSGTITDIPASPDTGNGYNLTLTDKKTNKSITVRVMVSTGIDVSQLQKDKEYDISGILSQYDKSSPYTDGYQIFPRSQEDIKLLEVPMEGELPLIYQIQPAKMEAIHDLKPSISAKLVKTAADLDWNTFSLKLDNVDLTAAVTRDETTGQVSCTPASDLTYGEHKLEISISDTGGKKNEVTSYFYVQKNLPDDQYHYYFGIPHSHTAFSDGKGTPADAYRHAYEKGLDFLVVTDHSNWLEGDQYITDKKEFQETAGSEWAQTKEMADQFNKDHSVNFSPSADLK